MIDPKKASKEDIKRGLELLQKDQIRKERIAKGEIKGYVKWSEMTDEQKDKARLAARRRNARIKLERQRYAQAVADGVIDPVTDDEVNAALT